MASQFDDRDRRLHGEWMQRFVRAMNQYDSLAAKQLELVLLLDPADYPVHKRNAAWMVAGAEIRRIYHAAKRYG